MNKIKEVLANIRNKANMVGRETWEKSYHMENSYVQNKRQPRLEVLFKIAEILDIKPKD